MRSYILTEREEQALTEFIVARNRAQEAGYDLRRVPDVVRRIRMRARKWLPTHRRQVFLLLRLLDKEPTLLQDVD